MRVFVTGVTGTFGTAFTEHVLHDGLAERVVGFSRDEVKQQTLALKLLGQHSDRLRLRLGDVRDFQRLCMAMDGCDTVVHAAALKIIAQGISNPDEMMRTNVLGTENVLRAAQACGVERVLVLSSDKRVHPANFYGNTKAMAEELAVMWNGYSYARKCRVGAVRYGNVFGSRGSVVHLFREAAKARQPLPITDTRMTRFSITPSVAIRFVLQCLDLLRGGEVFVPHLASMRVMDLGAAVLGRESLQPADYRIIGIRAGEKIHEAMIAPEEATRTVQQETFYVVEPPDLSWPRLPWSGPRLPDGWGLTSDRNREWLTVEDLARQVGRL